MTERDAERTPLFLGDSRLQSRCIVSKVQRRFSCCGLLDLLSKAVPTGSALGASHLLHVFFAPLHLDSLQTN